MQCIEKTGEGAPLGRLRQRIGRKDVSARPAATTGKRRMNKQSHRLSGAGGREGRGGWQCYKRRYSAAAQARIIAGRRDSALPRGLGGT
nr:unnamed protein product [Digitaria exilis]